MNRLPWIVFLVALHLQLGLAASAPPSIMLWAWERPGDLRGLPSSAGVAFLASSLSLQHGSVQVTPRFQPLRLSPGAYRMAVIRIETSAVPEALTPHQRRAAVDAISGTVAAVKPDAVQLDFDARASERSFYSALIRDVRARLSPGTFLSITALVSWCGAPSFLDRLPVDEIVPMAFEMGPAGPATETLLRSGGEFANPVCRGSIGIAMPSAPPARKYSRTYVFAYQNWTAALSQSILSQLP